MEEKDNFKIIHPVQMIKLINAHIDLTLEGNIAKVLYKEMQIPENFKLFAGNR